MEALIRWNHPQFGLVSPMDFIPIAEETGLIYPIGKWVFYNACKQYSKWYNAGHKDKLFAINLSVRQLQKINLPKILKEILSSTKLPAKNLALELTETAIMEHSERAENLLRKLHHLGVQIAIDDFGTGYSSLNRLKKLPINALKIDQSFIKDIANNIDDTTIIKSIIALAESLNLNVIAEGIESEDQLQFLIKHKCMQGQGFYFGKPISEKEMTRLLSIKKVKQKI